MILYNETIACFHARVNVNVCKCAGNWCFESYINSTVRLNQKFMPFLLSCTIDTLTLQGLETAKLSALRLTSQKIFLCSAYRVHLRFSV